MVTKNGAMSDSRTIHHPAGVFLLSNNEMELHKLKKKYHTVRKSTKV